MYRLKGLGLHTFGDHYVDFNIHSFNRCALSTCLELGSPRLSGDGDNAMPLGLNVFLVKESM